jgi:hypothetical protein
MDKGPHCRLLPLPRFAFLNAIDYTSNHPLFGLFNLFFPFRATLAAQVGARLVW